MNNVRLKQYDTCYTYALKRVGLFDIYNNVDIDDFIKLPEIKILKSAYPIYGNIIFWDDGTDSYHPNEIDPNGMIISHKWKTGLHFAVMENNGYISDCTKEDTENVYPILRMRKLNDIHNKPNIIVILGK